MTWKGNNSTAHRTAPDAPAHLARALALAWLVLGAPGAGLVFSDEILAGEQRLRRVEIIGLEAGMIEYRTPSGRHDALSIGQVDLIAMDSASGLADFNSAEEFLYKGHPAQAVERYERALRATRGFRAELVRARLLMAADRAGLFEKAVRRFLALAARDPVSAAQLLPVSLPTERSKATVRTIRRIEQALADDHGPEAHVLTELLRYATLRGLSDPAAAGLAERMAGIAVPAALLTPRTMAIKLAALDDLLRAKRYPVTVRAADTLIGDAPAEALPELLLRKARALYESARTDEDYLEAALPAMRVAIHYAETESACEGLLLAAEAHEASGRMEDAVRLLRECLGKDSAHEDTKQRARRSLARLAPSKASP